MAKLDLDDIVKFVNDLPSLPNIVVKIMELTDNPKVTAKDINKVLSCDQGLAAKTLRMANSAYYGFSRRISTVTEATICLGFKTIRSIVMATSVNDLLNKELKGYGLDKGHLWTHSQSTALMAKGLANCMNKTDIDGEVAFTAGLLHDIGKIILDDTMKEVYPEVMKLISEKDILFVEAETQILGFNHANAGALVAERWNLPPELVESIAYHHSPGLGGDNKTLAVIINLADSICISMEKGTTVDNLDLLSNLKAMQFLGLQDEQVRRIASDTAAKAQVI